MDRDDPHRRRVLQTTVIVYAEVDEGKPINGDDVSGRQAK